MLAEDIKRLKRIRKAMIRRCYNSNTPTYKYYGARGIIVCDKWLLGPWNFIHWALDNGYKHGLTIDRRENDDGYYPSNCRWVTQKVQNFNKRNNIWYKNKMKQEAL